MEKIMTTATDELRELRDGNHVHELANQANELTEDELNHVSGGKLLEAATKGQVFKKVEIHGTA
jgi:bacteriocin-like protein